LEESINLHQTIDELLVISTEPVKILLPELWIQNTSSLVDRVRLEAVIVDKDWSELLAAFI
jgi:hypothetical protein